MGNRWSHAPQETQPQPAAHWRMKWVLNPGEHRDYAIGYFRSVKAHEPEVRALMRNSFFLIPCSQDSLTRIVLECYGSQSWSCSRQNFKRLARKIGDVFENSIMFGSYALYPARRPTFRRDVCSFMHRSWGPMERLIQSVLLRKLR